MKKNTLKMALLAGALIAPELMAQQNPNRQRPPRQGQTRDRISRLAEELKLTEKQREQWAKVTAEQSEKQRALFANRDVPIEKRREQFAALRKETQEKQEKILNKEQLAKYKEMTQGRPSRPGQGPGARPGPGQGPGEGRPGGRPGEGRPGGGRQGGGFGFGRNQFSQLDLTEKQQEKITAIQEAQGAELQKMLQELRNGGGDFQAMREKMTEMREKFEKQTQAILTDEQKKKLAEMSAQRGQDGRGGRGQGGSRDPFAGIDGIKEEQKKTLNAAREAMSTQLRGLFTDRDTPREERSAKMQEIRETYEATIKKTLTEEQFKKYQESRSRGGGRGQGQGRRPGQGGFGGSRDPFAGIDGIKEEQKKTLNAAREAMSTQMRPLYSRDSGLSREERSAKMQEIRETYEAAIKKTLTEEQFKKYQESRSRGRGQGGFGGRRPGGERTRPQREDF